MLKLSFKAITPVFIGSGEVLEDGFDYIIEDGSFRRYNDRTVLTELALNGNFDFTKAEKITLDFLKTKIAEISSETKDLYEYEIKLLSDSTGQYGSNKSVIGRNGVREFINSNGKFYIPGSSIKGCLTTLFRPVELRTNSIHGRFLIHDSGPIESRYFEIADFDWFPYQSFMTLKAGTEFTITVPKTGYLTKENLKQKISSYFKSQFEKAIISLTAGGGRNWENVEELENFFESNKDQMLVNVGYGGGSWFKMDGGNVPGILTDRCKSPSKMTGWCSVKIDEVKQ